jgi:hypothetical protein
MFHFILDRAYFLLIFCNMLVISLFLFLFYVLNKLRTLCERHIKWKYIIFDSNQTILVVKEKCSPLLGVWPPARQIVSDGSYVKGYRCEGNIFQSVCVCLLCKN